MCHCPQDCANTGQLYFGEGSKLTVLGKQTAGGTVGVRCSEQDSYSMSSGSEMTCQGRRISGMDAGNSEALMVGGDLSWGWDSRSGQHWVFVLSLEAVGANTQYFGSGTRLTVLGKLGARGEGEGAFPCRIPRLRIARASFCPVPIGCESKHLVFRCRHPTIGAR